MPMFRKKPVVIEARQLAVETLEEVEAWCGGSIKGIKLPPEERVIDIQTLEGEMRASLGDWIIRGVKGEFYPCKPDIFAATYEPSPSAAPTLCRFCVAQGRPPHTEGECPHHNRPSPSAAPATGGEEP